MQKFFSLLVLSFALVLGACTTQQGNRNVGGALGGIAGGVLGAQFGEGSGKTAATIGGALLGMWVGQSLSDNLTSSDRAYYGQATQQAQQAPIGQTVYWNNPETGNEGTITPMRDGRTAGGAYCREFQQTIMVDGRTERAYGTACRQPDGTWQIVR